MLALTLLLLDAFNVLPRALLSMQVSVLESRGRGERRMMEIRMGLDMISYMQMGKRLKLLKTECLNGDQNGIEPLGAWGVLTNYNHRQSVTTSVLE